MSSRPAALHLAVARKEEEEGEEEILFCQTDNT